jgi:acyl transferase domain-containing protein
MVVTGGVDTLNDIFMHMCFAKTQALSTTGDARPFSKDADGTVLGEGIGILVLKRLEAAQKDGNRIYALIKGLGSSSDGKSQSIYSPRPEGQAQALRSAYENAAINPATVGLIEAHGTGTRVGDKVEFEALNKVFGEFGANGYKSALGSVKSMIGHTKASAGAAGLIKTALSLYHKVLPPTLKAETPDPGLDIENSHFYLNTKTRPWFSSNGNPRRAGVSAFGFGGSNFHVVLEEYHPEKSEISWDGSVDIIAFSANTIPKLARNIRDYKDENSKGRVLRESAIKAAQSRKRFSPAHPYRLLIVHDQDSALSDLLDRALAGLDSGGGGENIISENIFFGGPEKPGKLAFVFPGQGSQYLNMGRDVVCTFPAAMQILANANKKFGDKGLLSDLIFPQTTSGEQGRQQQEATLRKTHIAQPAIGAISLAMLNVLQNFDVRPDATCGHSFGELTALCAAGWIDNDSLLQLATKRGRLMAEAGGDQNPPDGAMLAVQAPLEDLEELLKNSSPEVVLANRNSPSQGVLSGPTAAILEIEKICRQKKINSIRLPVAAAFHTDQVKSAGRPFQNALKKIAVHPTAISVFSNTTGKAYPTEASPAKSLLGNHLTRPVDFVSEIENLYATGVRTFVEIGPKSVLTGLISAILQNQDINAWALDASAGKKYGITDLARLLGRLASLGYPVALTEWEKTDATVRKSRMNVLLSGTNYRNQKTDALEFGIRNSECGSVEGRKQPTGTRKLRTESREQTPEIVNYQKPKQTNEHNSNMSKDTSKQPAFILDALKVVQEGLKSMQHLQSQTAAAHQKFLETQTEVNRSLQAMMQNTQRLAEQSLGLDSKPLRPVFSPQLPTPENRGTAANVDGFTDSIAPAVTDHPPLEPLDSADEKPPELAANGYAQAPENRDANPEQLQPQHQDQQSIVATMLEVVSQLTGYPTEMLGLEMDIEAELGIDSIKRVEILSTLEEKMPDLPTVSPEIMGSLKTLGQIVEYLAETGIGNGIADSSSNAAASADIGATSFEPPAHTDQAPEVEATMLEVVSQLTGYPIEMLGLDMDIEAELGIDSIKRVEILSTLEEKMPDLPTVSPEIMGSLKTLGQIVEYLAESRSLGIHPETIDVAPKKIPEPGLQPGDVATIPRNVVSFVEAPSATPSRLSLAQNRKVFVTEDNTGLSEQIAEELTRQGINTIRISLDILKYKKQLPAATGLIIVQDPGSDAVDTDLKYAFTLAKYLAPSLIESADQDGAIFATVTRLDGAFGLKGRQITQPNQGGLAGLVKTAAIEWQNVFCRAIDIAPDWSDQRQVANAIVTEVLSPGPVEIGLDSDQRYTVTLQPEPYPDGHINLAPGDVVVISGGARGITAAAALALAKETALTLVLLGRSPQPAAEPGWLSTLSDDAAIKKAILENEFNGRKVTPAEIEDVFKSHMANREIAVNLAELKSTGAEAYYYETDIRDFTMVQTIMADIRNTHGPIAGIIHGAGVLEDRLIIDKTLDQFERVFDTKVKGLENLLANTGQDQLKYLVLFSSVAARMGNRGQADYAMANEVLNKMALNEAAKRPDCRIVAINWGPWDGGMVTSQRHRPDSSQSRCSVHA